MKGVFISGVKISLRNFDEMINTFFEKNIIRTTYFLSCCVVLVCLSMIRSAPVYGKLDFVLRDSRPWWPTWKPMILSLMEQGDRPVWTDQITSTVLKGVFGQDTILFRYLGYSPRMRVEEMDRKNRPLAESIAYGSILLLLHQGTDLSNKSGNLQLDKFTENGLIDTWISVLDENKNSRPYRCVINLQGFQPSWVPWETKHWNPLLANTGMSYSYYSKTGSSMESELRKNPPENCEVFY